MHTESLDLDLAPRPEDLRVIHEGLRAFTDGYAGPVNARPFAQKMLSVLNSLAARVDPSAHPLHGTRGRGPSRPSRARRTARSFPLKVLGRHSRNIWRFGPTVLSRKVQRI